MFQSLLRSARVILLSALVFSSDLSLAQDAPGEANITVVGSRIVARVFEALADASEVEAALSIDVTGTSSGLEVFCAGQADAALANRPISAEEDTVCGTNTIDYSELLLGHEALAFVTGRDNTFLQCLTTDQLNTIFAPSAEGQVVNWTQVDETFNDTPLTFHIPNEESVTYALLDQLVEGDGVRGDVTTSRDATAITTAVGEESGTLGVVSLTVAQAAGEAVKILEVDSGTGCTAPSAENIEARVYSPANHLFVYVNSASLDNPGLRDLLTFAVSDEAVTVVESLGATAPTNAAYATNRDILTGAEGGRQFSVAVSSFEIPASVSGQINIGGASSAFSYLQAMAQTFNTAYPGVTININIEGEPAGFRRLCNGELEIAAASGRLSEEQAQNCEANNIAPLTFDLGKQATVLVGNAESEFLQCLTAEQIATIWRATPTDAVTNWNTVSSDFPDLEMTLFAPEAGSTLTDLMLRKVVNEAEVVNRVDTEMDNDPLYRAAATANVAGALTYMSWPEYQRVSNNNQSNIQLVSVDNGSGCGLPSADTIADGSYPLTQPVQLVVNQTVLARTEVTSFLWYLLSDENVGYLDEAGLVGVTFTDLAAARNTLQSAYTEAATAALQPEATTEPNAETTAETTAEPSVEATIEATAEATEASGG